MSMEWIRKSYSVPAKRGGRVEYTGNDKATLGTITGTYGSRLRICLDGEPRSGIFHPTWCLRYITDEDEHMFKKLENLSPFIILANARRTAKRIYATKPNWSLAMEIFGLGSTYARALCIRENIDPDACTVQHKKD